jgi:transposase InsO family protein
MQTLFSDIGALSNPKKIIAKLRDIGRHEKAMKRQIVPESSTGATALSTNANNNVSSNNKPKTIHHCKYGKHNPAASHSEANCWTLHPEKREEQRAAKRARPATYHTTTGDDNVDLSGIKPAFAYNTAPGTKPKLSTVLDSGASNHMINSLICFVETTPTQISILTGSGLGELTAVARGTAILTLEDGQTLTLEEALYVPKLTRNLVSMMQLMKRNLQITTMNGTSQVTIDRHQPFNVDISNDLIELKVVDDQNQHQACLVTTTKTALTDYIKWHNRLGHASSGRITRALPDKIQLDKTHACSACMLGKLTKQSCNGSFKPVNAPLEAVHADLVGPITPSTNGGARYFLTLVDQFTGYIHTVILKTKDQSAGEIMNYKRLFEKQSGHSLKKLITDGGGEFCNNNLTSLLSEHGIQHNVSPPYTPQNNGIAERANRTILDMTRCLLMQANLAPEWWGEAVRTATATTNCLPSLGKGNSSPLESMFKAKPNLNFFRPFGCRAWVVKPKENREIKLGSLSWEGIFIGYENDYSSYRILRTADNQIITAKHAHFDEATFPECSALNKSVTEIGINKLPSFTTEEPMPFAEEPETTMHDEQLLRTEEEEIDCIISQIRSKSPKDSTDSIVIDEVTTAQAAPKAANNSRYTWTIAPPEKEITSSVEPKNIIADRRRRHAFLITVSSDPKTHKQAMASHDHQNWKEAELKEIANMMKHHVWKVRA